MKENNPVTVAEETKRLEENPISPPTAPVVTASEQSAVPTPTVTATPNVPTAPIVENVAKEEVSIGGTPPAPVTPVPTPATPTDYKWDAATNSYKEVAKATATPPTTPATPTEAKVPSTDKVPGTDKTQAEFDKFVGREKEVLTNLNEAYASGIKDGDGIRKFASYDTATPEKKAAIDAFILSKRKEEEGISSGSQFGSEEGIYGALVNNVMVPPSVKNTPAYKSAELRFQKFKFLTSASTDTLKELIKNGKLVPGTKTYNDFYNTPTGKANIDKANKLLSISGGSVDTGKAGQNMTKEVLTGNATLAKALEDGEITGEELNSLTSSPELVAKGKELAAKKLEIDKLQLAKKGIKEDIDKQYGAKLTASQRAAVINNRIRDIDRSLDTLLLEYNSEFGQYSQEKEQKLALFNTNLALYKEAKKAEADKLAKIEEREYEDEKEKNKRVYDSVNSQIKFALENGVDLMRTDANVVIDDAKRYAEANGLSLAQAINETFTTPLTAKPSYSRALQAIYDKNSGALTPYQKAQLAQGDREFALSMAKFGLDERKLESELNKAQDEGWSYEATGETDEYGNPVKKWVRPPKPGETVEDVRKESEELGTGLKVGEEGGQCGTFARKEVGFKTGLDAIVGRTYKERVGKMGDTTPIPGGLVLFGGEGYNKEFGHIAVVTGVNPDGTINVRESNYREDGKVTERNNVPVRNVKGYYNSTPLAKGSAKEAPHPVAVEKLALLNKGTPYSEIEKTFGSKPIDLKIKKDFDALVNAQGGKPVYSLDNPTVKGLDEVKKIVDELVKNETQAENVSGTFARAWVSPYDTVTKKRSDFLNQLNNVLTNDVLKKFVEAKQGGVSFGQFTQKELELLKNASSIISSAKKEKDDGSIDYIDLSEEKFKKALRDMSTSLDGSLNAITGGAYSKVRNENLSKEEQKRRAKEELEKAGF